MSSEAAQIRIWKRSLCQLEMELVRVWKADPPLLKEPGYSVITHAPQAVSESRPHETLAAEKDCLHLGWSCRGRVVSLIRDLPFLHWSCQGYEDPLSVGCDKY